MEELESKLKAYKAVTNKTRLKILLAVVENKDGTSFGELRRKLNLNSNALNFHLGKLADAKLIVNIVKTPTTTRSQDSSSSELSTLALTGRKMLSIDTHYSYYQITTSGIEILAKIGIKRDSHEGI